MKNLSLFVTLGLVTLMGACNAVNSGTNTSEEVPAPDSSVILESTDGTNVEEPNLEAQTEQIPVVDGSADAEAPELEAGVISPDVNGDLTLPQEDATIGAEEAPELEAGVINPDANGDLTLPQEDATIGAEEAPELEANEINPEATNEEIILPETENVVIPTDKESAEVVDPVAEPAQ